MKANKVMLEFLKKADIRTGKQLKIPDALLNPKFLEWDGCILLDRNINKDNLPSGFIPDNVIPDRTGFEALENDVHVNDYYKRIESKPINILGASKKIMQIWEVKLKEAYPDVTFHVILSFDGTDCILRFHRLRKEEGTWLDSNLEGYKEEGVLVKEV